MRTKHFWNDLHHCCDINIYAMLIQIEIEVCILINKALFKYPVVFDCVTRGFSVIERFVHSKKVCPSSANLYLHALDIIQTVPSGN
jgi:hypothetical protein